MGEHKAYFKGCLRFKTAKNETISYEIERIPGYSPQNQDSSKSFKTKREEYNKVCGVSNAIDTVNKKIDITNKSQTYIESAIKHLADLV